MKTIPLTRGYEALVDDEDYEWLSQWKWHASIDRRHPSGPMVYARRNQWDPVTKTSTAVFMHQEIMRAELEKNPGMTVDHSSRNSLDNQRGNLRLATKSQQMGNRVFYFGRHKRHSRFKGVSFDIRKNHWTAQIRIDYRLKTLGRFNTEVEAARAYNDAARLRYGAFAVLNDIDTVLHPARVEAPEALSADCANSGASEVVTDGVSGERHLEEARMCESVA